MDAEVEVCLPSDGSWKKMEDFLKEDANESLHEFIRLNVFTATRNFMRRVNSFKKHILLGINNPMNIRRFSWKCEFQARGAGHIHGVGWVDLKKASQKLEFYQKSDSDCEGEMGGDNNEEDKTVLEKAFQALRENVEL